MGSSASSPPTIVAAGEPFSSARLITAPPATVLPLDRSFAVGLLEGGHAGSVRTCAQAWLHRNDTARARGFCERVALKYAARRWDQVRTAPRLVWP